MTKKICPICQEEFAARDSRHTYCGRKCFKKAHYQANKDKARAYYQKNREAILEYSKADYQANREKRLASTKRWAARNPDKVKQIWVRKKERMAAQKAKTS